MVEMGERAGGGRGYFQIGAAIDRLTLLWAVAKDENLFGHSAARGVDERMVEAEKKMPSSRQDWFIASRHGSWPR